ncbi:hypothetical protein [Kitasatospora sp. NPDC059571]|uniref:hypothetical protein n=1 Tax=Kitasatospora sp. NPDC059571 TaxID=3346871 RepID=UPI00367AAE9D
MRAYDWSRPQLSSGGQASRSIEEIFGLGAEAFAAVPVLSGVSVPSSGLTYVTGYSGAGKSKLLELFLADHPEAHVPSAPTDDRPLLELFDLPLPEALHLLGQVGLGEAFCYLTPYRQLSDGQRTRARIALAYAGDHRLLVIDEFLSTLDRTSAQIAAYGFQRFCRRNKVSAVVATAHADLADALGPDLLITLDYNGQHTGERPDRGARTPFADRITVRRGTLADYDELSRFHYMGGLDVPPDAFDLSVQVAEVAGKVAAVKVQSPPYPRSWERFRAFRDVNESLTVSRRTVVHPVFRSLGLARIICNPQLADRPRVFIRSALGRFQPFPLSAGYREVPVASNRRTELAAAVDDLFPPGDSAGGRAAAGTPLSAEVTAVLRLRCVELLLNEYVQYRELAGLTPLDGNALDKVRIWFERCNELLSGDQLLSAARPLAMAGFIAEWDPLQGSPGPGRPAGHEVGATA